LRQFARVNSPAVEDIQIDWGGLKVTDVFPNKIGRLYDMEPLIITARCTGTLNDDISIKGKVNDEDFVSTVSKDSINNVADHDYLKKFWAHQKIFFCGGILQMILSLAMLPRVK